MFFSGPLLGFLLVSTVQAQAVAPVPAPPSAPPVTFPAPRYTPAGAGAPALGQPGQQVAPIARSPNTRVLPPTNEPGVWAADEPSAVKKAPDKPRPDTDELLLPLPSPGAPTLASCRQRVLRASKAVGKEEMRRNLPRTSRECLTARLLLHCANREMRDLEVMAMQTPWLDGVNPIAAQQREAELTFYWQMHLCESFRSLPNIEALFSAIITKLEQQFRSDK